MPVHCKYCGKLPGPGYCSKPCEKAFGKCVKAYCMEVLSKRAEDSESTVFYTKIERREELLAAGKSARQELAESARVAKEAAAVSKQVVDNNPDTTTSSPHDAICCADTSATAQAPMLSVHVGDRVTVYGAKGKLLKVKLVKIEVSSGVGGGSGSGGGGGGGVVKFVVVVTAFVKVAVVILLGAL